MKLLVSAFRRGFSTAREDRLAEWSTVRTSGFWRYWARRGLPILLPIAVVVFAGQVRINDPLPPQLLACVLQVLAFLVAFLIIDHWVWRSTEKEWNKWKSSDPCSKMQRANDND